ncbi:MAG: alpha/beta hydrolase family protein, partial [Myxococcota bacterium]
MILKRIGSTRSSRAAPLRETWVPGLHRIADDVATGALRVPRLYPDGFGSRLQIDRTTRSIADYDVAMTPPAIEVLWGPPTRRRQGIISRGEFRSPTLHIPLPPESRTAALEWIEPVTGAGPNTPVVLHLAASGEVGFFSRRRTALALAQDGIVSVSLENPFYGSRKPAGQRHAALRTVSDQFAMNYATVEEGRAILAYLRRLGFSRIAVTGYSQGGVMAAFCAALTSFPVAVAARAAADSVADLFTRDNFSQLILWDRLAADAGDDASARAYFRAALDVVTVSRFPAPVQPVAAVILAGRPKIRPRRGVVPCIRRQPIPQNEL